MAGHAQRGTSPQSGQTFLFRLNTLFSATSAFITGCKLPTILMKFGNLLSPAKSFHILLSHGCEVMEKPESK